MKKFLSILLAATIFAALTATALVTPSAQERSVVIYSMPFTMEATQEPIGGWWSPPRPFWAGESNDGQRYGLDPVNDYTTMEVAAEDGGGLRFWRSEDAVGRGDFQRNPIMINYISNAEIDEMIFLHLDTPMTIDIDITQGPNFDELQPQNRSINAFFVLTFAHDMERHSFIMNHYMHTQMPSHQETWGIFKGEFTPREMLENAMVSAEDETIIGNHVENRVQQARMAERILELADSIYDGFMPLSRVVLFAAVDHPDHHEDDIGPDNFGIVREFSFGIDRDTLPPGQEGLIGEDGNEPAPAPEPEVSEIDEEPADTEDQLTLDEVEDDDSDGLPTAAIVAIGAGVGAVMMFIIILVLVGGKKKNLTDNNAFSDGTHDDKITESTDDDNATDDNIGDGSNDDTTSNND